MSFLKKVVLIAVLVFLVFTLIAYVFLSFTGRQIAIREIERFTHEKVTVGSFYIVPPMDMEIKNLNIGELGKIDHLSISLSIPYLIFGKIGINRLVIDKPELNLHRDKENINVPVAVANNITASSTVRTKTGERPRRKHRRIILKRVFVKNGKLNFTDNAAGSSGIKIVVKDVNFSLTNLLTSPFSSNTNFDLSGKIPWKEGKAEGKINAEGWIDFYKKDMKAKLKISDIDGVYLYPYYSAWVDLEKARIASANLDFTSNINGKNNNVTAECHLELSNIVRKKKQVEEGQKPENVSLSVLDIFKAMDQGKVVLDFTLRTKMDKPELGFGSIKMAFEEKVAEPKTYRGFRAQDILEFPSRLLEGVFKGSADLSKAAIDGIFAVGNEAKKNFEPKHKRRKLP